MKRLIIAAIALTTSLYANAVWAAGADLSFSGPKEVRPGQMFQVVVEAAGLQNADTIRLNGTFNPDVISWVQAQPLAALNNVSPGTFVDAAAGAFSFGSFSLSGGLTGQAKLAAITFRAKKAGTASISLDKTSRVLSNGEEQTVSLGSITIKVAESAPLTGGAVPGPTVGRLTASSPTHPESNQWYADGNAVIEWRTGQTPKAVYVGFDQSPAGPADMKAAGNSANFTAAKDGVWYAHILAVFGNGTSDQVDFPVKIDRQPPRAIQPVVDQDLVPSTFPNAVRYGATDDISGIAGYMVFIDGRLVTSTTALSYPLSGLGVGEHTVKVEAFDFAGNHVFGQMSYTVAAGPAVAKVLWSGSAAAAAWFFGWLWRYWLWCLLLIGAVCLMILAWRRVHSDKKRASARKRTR